MTRVRIDQDLCMGTGVCEHLAPEQFSVGADGKAVLHPAGVAGSAERIDAAARSCPQGAIVVEPDGAPGDERG
jgi:ferredoxin